MDPKRILEELAIRTAGRLAPDHAPKPGEVVTVPRTGGPGPGLAVWVFTVPYPSTTEGTRAWLARAAELETKP